MLPVQISARAPEGALRPNPRCLTRARTPALLFSARLSASISLAFALSLSACGDPAEDPNYQMPPGLVTTGDAQVALDAGVAPQSNDSGIKPVTSVDAQVAFDSQAPVLVDATVATDAQPVALGDAASGDGAVATADAGPPRMDLEKGNGKDVITIGDSWMLLLFTGIQESLVTASGNQPYRKYAAPGTRMLNGAIPGQYTRAKGVDPNIKTVVMTGGGNDIIQNMAIEAECKTGGPMCTAQLEKIGKALSDLWAQMSKDGVQDVIHVMYSAAAGDGVKDREMNNQNLATACASVPPPLRCHLLNTDQLILKADMRADGIHPTDQGYDKIGKAVWDLMVKEGMRR